VRKIKLVVIAVVIAIITVLGWYFASSYDFAPSTTDNPFGVQATLEYVKDLKISCPISPCDPLNAFMLSYHSKKPVQIVSYNICGGIFCIKRDGIGYSLGGGRGTVGEIPWRLGDTVDIRVKVKPVEILEDGKVMPKDEMYFIDLEPIRKLNFEI
jgi:hypothetical protein